MTKIKLNTRAKMVVETALVLGYEWLSNHKLTNKFHKKFDMWTGKAQIEFLGELAVIIEETIANEGGWDVVEGKWVWDEFIGALVKYIIKETPKYKDLKTIKSDIPVFIRRTINRTES